MLWIYAVCILFLISHLIYLLLINFARLRVRLHLKQLCACHLFFFPLSFNFLLLCVSLWQSGSQRIVCGLWYVACGICLLQMFLSVRFCAIHLYPVQHLIGLLNGLLIPHCCCNFLALLTACTTTLFALLLRATD